METPSQVTAGFGGETQDGDCALLDICRAAAGRLGLLFRLSKFAQEGVEGLVEGSRAFQVGEVAGFRDDDHAAVSYG